VTRCSTLQHPVKHYNTLVSTPTPRLSNISHICLFSFYIWVTKGRVGSSPPPLKWQCAVYLSVFALIARRFQVKKWEPQPEAAVSSKEKWSRLWHGLVPKLSLGSRPCHKRDNCFGRDRSLRLGFSLKINQICIHQSEQPYTNTLSHTHIHTFQFK